MPEFRKLVLACEYALDREALVNILASESDLEIVTQISKPRDIERIIIGQIKPDLLILDMDMPYLDLLGLLRLIRAKAPNLIVLLLVDKYDEKKIIEAVCAGSLGYILKSTSASELIKSIRSLMNGEAWIERRIMAKVISRVSLPITSSVSVVQGM